MAKKKKTKVDPAPPIDSTPTTPQGRLRELLPRLRANLDKFEHVHMAMVVLDEDGSSGGALSIFEATPFIEDLAEILGMTFSPEYLEN